MASIKDKILLVLGSVFLVVLLGLLIFDLSRRGVFSNKMGINVAIVGDNGVSILLLRPEEGMVGWINLPKNIRVKIYNSEAHYPLESVWEYGVSEKKPYEITEKSLGQSMGVVIARAIKIEDSSQIENVLGKLYSLGLKTDISIRDRVLIRRFLSDAVKSKEVLEMSVPASVFDKVTDPDGASFFEFNLTMSLWTKNKFVVEPILNENADISINNISGVSGLGSIYANQLESTGMHITELKANPEEIVAGKSCVYASEKRYEMTESVLKDQMGCDRITRPDFAEQDEKMRIWVR